MDYTKAPFPWFGGKRNAAPLIWQHLGDVGHYVEPFMGSLAVLLQRPHLANRAYHSETVNDLDGLLVNAFRAIQFSPDATADAASWPVSEADLHARHSALVRWRHSDAVDHLCGDPAWHDPVLAGWWIWGQSSWIGSGWSSGQGPWVVDERGCLVKGSRPGVKRQLLHIGDNGKGVNHAGAREPGVGDEPDFHPMTMPEIQRWFRFLSARLRHVRILNGGWERAVTNGATKTLSVDEKTPCGVMLDPPYGDVRRSDLYAKDDLDVAELVRAWCLEHGDDPCYRIALCGFSGEGHESLVATGWIEVEWFKNGFLTGGMANTGAKGTNQRQERIWFSPHCLDVNAEVPQMNLFGEVAP